VTAPPWGRNPRRATRSPVKAAIRAAMPADGSPISTAEARVLVQDACPTVAAATIPVTLVDMATDGELVRVERGLYRRGAFRASVSRGTVSG
jgi:hypothetical protein